MNAQHITLSLALLFGAATAAGATDNAASPAQAKAERHAKLAKLCDGCALVDSVKTVERKPKGSGVGIVGGAVVGGLLGNQVGGGTGKTVATGAGIVAGGIAGNEIEKSAKKYTVWVTHVTLKNGTGKTFEQRTQPGFRAGDVVQVQGQQLALRK
ncbi:MAG TPA: glycine zipper 2TM domain-containing protein [Albitalea sp.]|nr:glycine zipper 2TM domain-containing protein [Albitalea sp.]HJW10704.1 glycine zipper 2TM domain-containing protein [Albitalea sp.]